MPLATPVLDVLGELIADDADEYGLSAASSNDAALREFAERTFLARRRRGLHAIEVAILEMLREWPCSSGKSWDDLQG
jgi:hypothetical protein